MSRIGDRGELEAFVRSVELGSFSSAARELKLSPSALSKLVTRLERLLCAAPAYLKRHGRPRAPEDLARHRIMGVSSIPLHTHWLFKGPSGPRAHEVQLTAAANNADCIYRFALSGVGIARLNEFVVADALRDGKLVTVLDDFHFAEELAMLVIYLLERHRLPRVAAMLDFLTQTFSHCTWCTLADR